MKYLLDTNACIALINGQPPLVRERFRQADDLRAEIYVSAIVAFELWYGVEKSRQQQQNNARLRAFFSGPIRLLAFDEEDSQLAGRIRAALEASGKSIGAYDLLIAGQALQRGFTLVTANAREFARVKGLTCEDWAPPSALDCSSSGELQTRSASAADT